MFSLRTKCSSPIEVRACRIRYCDWLLDSSRYLFTYQFYQSTFKRGVKFVASRKRNPQCSKCTWCFQKMIYAYKLDWLIDQIWNILHIRNWEEACDSLCIKRLLPTGCESETKLSHFYHLHFSFYWNIWPPVSRFWQLGLVVTILLWWFIWLVRFRNTKDKNFEIINEVM